MMKHWIKILLSVSLLATFNHGNAASTLVWKPTGKRELLHDGSPVAAVVLLKDKIKHWNVNLPKNYSSLLSLQGSIYTNHEDFMNFQIENFLKGALEIILFPNTSWFSVYLSVDSFRPNLPNPEQVTQEEAENTGTALRDSSDFKQQQWTTENIDNCNIILGNLASFPVYAQFGIISVPFGASFSAVFPSQEIPTRKVYYPRGIGSALVGAHYHVQKKHVIDAAVFFGMPTHEQKALLFGIETQRDVMGGGLFQYAFKKELDSFRMGGSCYYYKGMEGISPFVYNIYFQGRWRRLGGLIERSKIPVRYAKRHGVRIEGAFRFESAVYFSLLNKPSTFAIGFSADPLEELGVGLLRIRLIKSLQLSVGAKIDVSQYTKNIIGKDNIMEFDAKEAKGVVQPVLQMQFVF